MAVLLNENVPHLEGMAHFSSQLYDLLFHDLIRLSVDC